MPLFRVADQLVHFVHIPKTGGSSIEAQAAAWGCVLLRGVRKGPLACSPQHFHREIYEALIPIDAVDYSFTVVRNPYTRMFSEYRFRGARHPFPLWWERSRRRLGSNPYLLDNHLRPQVAFLAPYLDVFRFENGLHEVLLSLAGRFKRPVPTETPHLLKPKADHEILVDEKTLESIREYYAADFEMLRYSTDADEVTTRPGIKLLPSRALYVAKWFAPGPIALATAKIVYPIIRPFRSRA